MKHLSLCIAATAMIACDAEVQAPNVTFDGARAFEYAKIQVEAGPRVPGSEAWKLVGDRIVSVLKATADTVIEQKWIHKLANGDSIPLRNIFAQFNPKATKRILYLSHYDSRPHADKSFSDDDKKRPVPGANDGASSTALLLVIAEALKAQPSSIGVDMLFTDGEDYANFGAQENEPDVLIGAQYFVKNVLPNASYKPAFGVLWDMVADKDLNIDREAASQLKAGDINDKVWALAKALGYGRNFTPNITAVDDDHTPFLRAGWKVIDVIDIDYPDHHKTTDTMDKISAQSLETVGRVAMAIIRSEEGAK